MPRKLTIDEIHGLALERGGRCLSDEYVNSSSKLKWECSKGHQWEANANSVLRGSWCLLCSGKAKGTIEQMQELAREHGGECLSTNYVNTLSKLKWKCAKGHIWETAPTNIKTGSWCPECSGKKKLTIKEINQIVNSRGGKCLSTTYKNNKEKLLWECEEGHQWEANSNSVLKGSWCPHCSGVARLTIQQMHEIAKERGGGCLSSKIINARTPLLWKCSKGHVWESKPSNMMTHGRWCPYCAGVAKLTIEEMHRVAKERGGKCLSDQYVNGRTALKWQCAEGHIWESQPKNITSGRWCPVCGGNPTYNIEDMHKLAQERGGKCLSTAYDGAHIKLLWECSEGHKWRAKPASIIQKSWCPKCAGKEKTIADLKSAAELRGGILLSREYQGMMVDYLWECGEGHHFNAKANSVLNANSWCPTCASGINERVCRKYFELLFGVEFKKRKPKWLHLNNSKSRLELDGFAEEIGVAFEYHGQQHYDVIGYTRSRKELEKRQKYDQIKRDRCKEKGVVLIEVPYTVAISDMEPFIRDECRNVSLNIPRQSSIDPEEIQDAYLKNTIFLSELASIAKGKGGKLIENQAYKGADVKLCFECAEGHRWEARPYGIKSGYWCPECAVINRTEARRGTIEEMQILALEKGGKCLSDSYCDSNTKLKWQCAEGHIWKAPPGSISSGYWCPKCSYQRRANDRKHDMSVIHALAESRDGRCLSAEYTSNRTKLIWECVKGHKWEMSYDSAQRGNWCPYCSGKAKGNIEQMQMLSKERGGECLSKEYVNTHTKLKWRCDKGHVWESTPTNIKAGRWCPDCSGRKKLTIEEMYEIAESRGGRCLSTKYVNGATPLRWQCSRGHQWDSKPLIVKGGTWCQECAKIEKSEKAKQYLNEMHEIAKSWGGKCLSDKYINSRSHLLWECKNGHQWKAIPANIKFGGWCPSCADRTDKQLKK